MLKRLSMIGALCIGLMALWGTGANAYPTRLGGGGWNGGSLIFNSTWVGAGNTEQRATDYEVAVWPCTLTVLFNNPGGNNGGVSINFINPGTITGGSTIIPPKGLSGKGKIEDTLTFGDDENGVLWLLWLPVATEPYSDPVIYCNTYNDELSQIQCIKRYLVYTYSPNKQWEASAISIGNFNALVEAYTDINKDGQITEEVVHAEYKNCLLDPEPNPDKSYSCNESIWNWKSNDPSPPEPHTVQLICP